MSDDPIASLMHQLRTRGRARLIRGQLGESVEVTEVQVEILSQPSLWDNEPANEELVVTLDTLETILYHGREYRR